MFSSLCHTSRNASLMSSVMDLISAHWAMLIGFISRHANKRVIVTCGLSVLFVRMFHQAYRRNQLNKRLKQKKRRLERSVAKLRAALDANPHYSKDELLALTELDLCELRKRIMDESLTPHELLCAYQWKALSLYDKGNSGICEFLLDADGRAMRIRKPKKSQDTTVYSPLYGIPVSIKETLMVENCDSTAGLIKRCNMPAKNNCVIVQTLQSANAVPFVITATSQALRSLDGSNAIFGDMVNPYHPDRITGGSSCGEAVLLAQKGSPVGIATDIGGSIRIPAAFCGLASLKPTYGRLSSVGLTNFFPNSVTALRACPGPMGRKVDDLVDVMRTLLVPDMFNADYTVVPLPFNETLFEDKDNALRIGFYDNFMDPEVMQTVPVIRESVNQVAATLAKAGFRVTRFEPSDPITAYRLFLRALFVDGGSQLRSLLAHEPVCKHLKMLHATLWLPNWAKSVGDFLVSIGGCKPMAVARTLGGLRHAKEVLELNAAIHIYRRKFEEISSDVDVIVCPVSAYPAPPRSAPSAFVTQSLIYAALYNLLDYPAGTVPVGFVDSVDVMEAQKAAVNQYLDGEWYQSRISLMQKNSEGLPVAVQVVGKPFREESVLRVMRLIEVSLTQRTES